MAPATPTVPGWRSRGSWGPRVSTILLLPRARIASPTTCARLCTRAVYSDTGDTPCLSSLLALVEERILSAILEQYVEPGTVTYNVILYFCIGRFLSSKKGKKTWGTGVLETISAQLRKELPGLRGFSAESLKKMRQFYENWAFLEDSNSTAITDETPVTAEKSVITTTDL